MLTAQNSIDQGNNAGWTIDELGNRTLYWVGGTGNWGVPAHWSLTSGGPGGECVPTLLDDVIFDVNSFTGPGQEVQGFDYNGYYCRDITWKDNLPDPLFNLNRLYCYGSVLFSQNMAVQMPEGLYMNSAETETIQLNGQALDAVHIEGSGSFTLLDSFNANVLFNHNGTFNTDGQPLFLNRWVIDNAGTQRVLNLGDSYITITDPADLNFNEYYSLEAGFSPNTTINPGTSIIELTNPYAGALLSGGIRFNNILFSGTDGLLNICHPENSSSLNNPAYLNLLEIGGDAIIKGFHTIDTLLLAPGKAYRLEQNVTQTVNEYLQILGNNCNPIELFSTLPGVPATISSSNAVVVGDFIQMRDQTATGGANFFAGSHSTNIDNSNQGWVFDDAPDYIDVGFFGPDRSICRGDVLNLSAYNYSPGETYEWSTGSTQSSIPVAQAGTYWARVTFGNMCEVIDTIAISIIEPAQVGLGPDASICEGESLVLDATAASPGVTYTWQDGSTNPTFEVTQSGDYAVELNKEGCITSDTISIEVLDVPAFTLGGNQELCQGQSVTLDASTGQPADYLWQDGSTQPTLAVSQSGTYTVTVTANGCEGTGQADITFNPLPEFSLGPDTSLCSGQSLGFDFTGLAGQYLWQDGATAANYSITQGGQFWLMATDNSCSFADTVSVTLQMSPEVNLGADRTLCEGEEALIEASISENDGFFWQDGSTASTLAVNQSGTYWIEVALEGCLSRDSISVEFQPPAGLGLPDSLTLCSGEQLVLRPQLPETGIIRWQDGSDSPEYIVEEEGIYSITVAGDACPTADTVVVAASSCGQISVYIPNAFSPNEDGRNDVFLPYFDPDYTILEYELQVFDRWGGLVFSSEEAKEGWDGIIKEQEANTGLYVYLLRFTFEDQGETFAQLVSGEISLLK
ncbi:MAG: gliding motility-associated C-terminal domain-containing protein [Lewinellaceae bacterium]|nr:gliding motility-associated C-terminal domain-containing protein [Lewinellaceae bacterium]